MIRIRRFKYFLFLLILLFVIFLPDRFNPNLIGNLNLGFIITLSLMLLFIFSIKISKYEILILSLLFWSILSLVLSSYFHNSYLNISNFETVLYIFVPMFIPTVIKAMADDFEIIEITTLFKTLVVVFALFGVFNTVMAVFPDVFRSLWGWEHYISRAIYGGIRPGTSLSLIFFPSLAFFFMQKKNKYRFFYLILTLMILIGIISTGRRASLLTIVTLTPLFLFFVSWKKNESLFKVVIILLLLSMSLYIFTDFLIGYGRLDRIIYGFTMDTVGYDGRLLLWKEAINNFIDTPILGTGINNYYIRGITSDPHNLFLMILVEVGIVVYGILILVSPAFEKSSPK